MVYDTWDYWVSGLQPLSGSLKKTVVWKMDLFPLLADGVGDISVSVRKS